MNDALQIRLVNRIRSGESSAENELFVKYRNAIYWKVKRHIKTGDERIKDVVSDICLAILQGIRRKTFTPERWQSLDAFIWGVTQNKIQDWFKRNRIEGRIFTSDPPETSGYANEDNMDSRLEAEDLKNLLRRALKQLKPHYKEILDLRYFQELSISQISKKLGIPPRRVSERIHYALKLMRKACKREKDLSIFSLILILFY